MRWMLVAVLLVSGLGACASEPTETSDGADEAVTGTIALPLITQSGGDTYRLLATFVVAGPTNTFVATGSSEDAVLRVPLPIGEYTIDLVEDWHLQKRVGTTYENVEAVLTTSLDGGTFTISAGRTTTISLQFALPTGTVSFTGELAIDFTVTPSCDLLAANTGCPVNQACFYLNSTQPIAVCASRPATPVSVGQPCQNANSCSPGSNCIAGSCRAVCDVTADDCTSGASCTPLNVGNAGYCPN